MVALVCGTVAITAIELGVPLRSPLVKLAVLVGSPLLLATTADAAIRIWRSAWAWMPVDAGRGAFRLGWFALTLVILAILGATTWIVLAA